MAQSSGSVYLLTLLPIPIDCYRPNLMLQANGRVIKKRIYTADGSLPGLIPSRSFGDLMGVRAGVVCQVCSACGVQCILICELQPDVCVYTISSEYRFIAIMSDGAAPVPLSIVCT